MSWNEENVSRLRDLWDQGLPTAQIGKLLGFTKNAVVGYLTFEARFLYNQNLQTKT